MYKFFHVFRSVCMVTVPMMKVSKTLLHKPHVCKVP